MRFLCRVKELNLLGVRNASTRLVDIMTSIFWTVEGVRPGDMEWAETGDISGVRTCSPITQPHYQVRYPVMAPDVRLPQVSRVSGHQAGNSWNK